MRVRLLVLLHKLKYSFNTLVLNILNDYVFLAK